MDERYERELCALVDREKIRDVLARYVRGVDLCDIELVRSTFHEDAVDCHGTATSTREELLERIPGTRDRDVSRHYLLNQLIDLDGDTAHVETASIVARKLPSQDSCELMGVRFLDRMERRSGEWKIALRVVVADWAMEGDAARMPEIVASFHAGSRDRNDPSYERPLMPRDPVTAHK